MNRRINPVARALLISRRGTSNVPNKKKYDRKKEKKELEEKMSTVDKSNN